MVRTAPAKVRKEAKLGLLLHKKWKRGGTAVGVARAVQLSSGKTVSDDVIKRMYSYFQRHQHDRLDKDGSDGSIPGRGYIAWLLWGGNSGRKWAEAEYKKIKAKKKNPITKPIAAIKKSLANKTIWLIKVTLDDFRSQAWAQEMVTKEEDFDVLDNFTEQGEPIFKTSDYVLSVLPKRYTQDFEFCRRMQMEGKLEKLPFARASRAWLENDQPLDWFNEQAQDRGYLDSNEYLFLVKVNNPVIKPRGKSFKQSNPARNMLNPDAIKFEAKILAKYLESKLYNKEKYKKAEKWLMNNYVKGIINSERSEYILLKTNEPDNLIFVQKYEEEKGLPEWFKKAFDKGETVYIYPEVWLVFPGESEVTYNELIMLNFEQGTGIDFRHFIDFIDSDNFPSDPSRVSFDQMRELVRQWDAEEIKISDESKIAEGEKLYKQYSNGWKWVLLTNKEAMQNESKISRMGHCIGRIDRNTGTNTFIDLVTKGKKDKSGAITSKGFAFSLRDKENNPYVTAFYVVSMIGSKRRGYFDQIQGYANCNINTGTYNQVDEKTRIGIQDRECEELPVLNSNEKYVADLLMDVERLEELTQSSYDKEATFEDYAEIDKLFLTVVKILKEYESTFDYYVFTDKQLPSVKIKDIIAEIHLSTTAKELPDSFKSIQGDLVISMNDFIEYLPDNITVGGDLEISKCRNIRNIGNNVKIGNNLFIKECKSIEKLPDYLEVGDSFVLLNDNKSLVLPKELKVGGDWSLTGYDSVDDIPKIYTVGGRIRIINDRGRIKNPTKEENPTRDEKVQATKDYLLELAKECGKRPSMDTDIGGKLKDYLCTDKAFKEKIKELCPDWFYQSSGAKEETIAAMEMFLEMAGRGEKRPSRSSKDPEEKKLGTTFTLLITRYPEFEEKIYQANREWTRRGQAEVIRETKNHLIELAGECGTRPPRNTILGQKLLSYLAVDQAFRKKMQELCPSWFYQSSGAREETIAAMKMFLEMAGRGEKRPSQTSKDPEEKKLGTLLYNLIASYPDFRKKLLETNRDWFRSEERKYFLSEYKEENPTKEEKVQATKDYLLELAKECGKRPPNDTALGKKLTGYLTRDKAFKKKIKELCPSWFSTPRGAREETKATMEMILEMARRGEKRPSEYSKDPQEKRLGQAIAFFMQAYPEFKEKLYQANREWTSRGQAEVTKETKNHLIELAGECGTRPPRNTILGQKLLSYLALDQAFRKKMQELCPSWFRQKLGPREETIAAMEMFLEMARRGEKRPSERSKDPEERKLGEMLPPMLLRYPEFRKKVLQANRDWLQSEERKRFFSEYKEENPSKSSEDKILKALRFAMIDYAILSVLKGAGIMGLPHFAIEQKVNEIVKNDNQKSMTVSIAERLKFYIENSYVFKRSLSPESFKENFPKAGRISDRAYCIDSEGLKLLEKIEELFDSLGHSINDLKDSEKLKASFKQKNPSKGNEMKPEEYFEILKAKKSNPMTLSHEKSEEYLPIVQKALSAGTDAWVDESTGDILVGSMAFEEDRSFDDVLIRIKTSGQIKEGESVDKSIKKSVHKLMKKIHMALAEYVMRKPNPSKEISEIKTNIKKLNKFFGFKKRNPNEKDIPYLSETLLSSDILLEYLILSIIKASGNSGAPLILIEKSVFEILMGGQEISEEEKGLNKSAKDKLEKSLYVKITRMISEWKRKKLNFIYERSPAKENELYSLLQKRPSDSKYYVIESDGIEYLNSIKLVIQQIIDKEEKIKDQQSIIELLSSYREKIIKMKNKGISRKIPEIDKVQEIVEEKIQSKKSNPVPAGVDPKEFDSLVKKLKKRKDVDNPYALANWILTHEK